MATKQSISPGLDPTIPALSTRRKIPPRVLYAAQIVLFVIVVVQFMMLYKNFMLVATACDAVKAGFLRKQVSSVSDSNLPDYFQTTPEIFAGPTPTGPAAFLAQTNPAPFPSITYVPPQPLETQVPIKGQHGSKSIFQMQGQLSHYFPNPVGFGVDEFPLPENASIVQLNMLSRHGARYPTLRSGAPDLAAKIQDHTDGTRGYAAFTGELSFLNNWKYLLGAEVLVPIGKQELFDSGTLHQYMYGHLYPNDGSKIVARTTSQDRMLKSAEYFLAGFFGLSWTDNATLVVALENNTRNNSLAGYYDCPNANKPVNFGGTNATIEWYNIYLANATERLHSLAPGFNWTVTDSYNAQSLCASETVALGYSAFCGLFTYEEWQGYEYSVDLSFAGNNAFQSPTGRAVGIGYVQETLARWEHHLITEPTANINVTYDNNTASFPLNQSLYFDFSHDTNIMGVLAAFGFTQFADVMPSTHIPTDRQLIVSHLEPFAARLDMELIKAPAPVDGARGPGNSYLEGGETTYVHFLLNQRTLPLGRSFPACGNRTDGWCELNTFLEVQSSKLEESDFDFACFGDYPAVPYGTLTDGVPQRNVPLEA